MATGAIVAGPRRDDFFADRRDKYDMTEVALDFNAALTAALAATVAGPADTWSMDCSALVPQFPWDRLAGGR